MLLNIYRKLYIDFYNYKCANFLVKVKRTQKQCFWNVGRHLLLTHDKYFKGRNWNSSSAHEINCMECFRFAYTLGSWRVRVSFVVSLKCRTEIFVEAKGISLLWPFTVSILAFILVIQIANLIWYFILFLFNKCRIWLV